MPYHIKRTGSIIDPSRTLYYKGSQCWTDNYDNRKVYSTKTKANADLKAKENAYGGTVVTE